MREFLEVSNKNIKAEIVFKNAQIIDVFSNKIITSSLAIHKGKIVGFGDYEGEKEIDLKWKYISPGFIDAHMHIESTMMNPKVLSDVLLKLGTTSIIADPHEIANVLGEDGINYMISSSEDAKLDIYFMFPSCVPATPFENGGATLDNSNYIKYINNPKIIGLAEVMNFVGVVNSDEKLLDMIKETKKSNKLIDGHAPFLTNEKLNSYIFTGIKTDHECSTIEEMNEKISKGMYVLIREGSAAKNLKTLIKGVNKNNINRCLFCTDDIDIIALKEEGHINNNVKMAIKEGVEPIDAIKMATINVSQCYNLKNKGAIAPGYDADLIIIDDLENFNILDVYKNGEKFEENKENKLDGADFKNTINNKNVLLEDFSIYSKSNEINVIKYKENSLITEKVVRDVEIDENNNIVLENSRFLNKLFIIERHNALGNIGKSIIEGFGNLEGVIGLSIGHDSHNLTLIGKDNEDFLVATNRLKQIKGGIVLVQKGKVINELPLEIAGLMSFYKEDELYEKYKGIKQDLYEKIKVNEKIVDPILALSFLGLPVIPELKLTDKGLFDVNEFKFISIERE